MSKPGSLLERLGLLSGDTILHALMDTACRPVKQAQKRLQTCTHERRLWWLWTGREPALAAPFCTVASAVRCAESVRHQIAGVARRHSSARSMATMPVTDEYTVPSAGGANAALATRR